MDESMICPICGSEETEPIMARPLVTLPTEPHPILGVLAYRCPNSHRFVVGILRSINPDIAQESLLG